MSGSFKFFQVNGILYVNYFHVNKHYFFRLSLQQLLLLLLFQVASRYIDDILYVNYFHVNKHYFFR